MECAMILDEANDPSQYGNSLERACDRLPRNLSSHGIQFS
jgi:hypothetical protein